MARPRKEGLVPDPTTGIYQIWYFDDKQNRSVAKTTGTTDKAVANAVYARHLETNKFRVRSGHDMTIGEAYAIYVERHHRHAPQGSQNSRESQWHQMRHLFENLKIADEKTLVAIHKFRDDLKAGRPVRKFQTEKGRRLHNKQLHSRSINCLLLLLQRIMNFVGHETDQGLPLFPQALIPTISLCPEIRGEQTRPSADLSLSEHQVAALFDLVYQDRIAAGETRLSINERLVALFYYGGGQRAGRVGGLPWANVKLKDRYIDFANVPGVQNSKTKPGNPHVDIVPELEKILKQAWAERGLDGENGDYVLGARFKTSAASMRVRRLFHRIGLEYGGSHVWRKTVPTIMEAKGQGHLAHRIIGTTRQTAERSYLKRTYDAERGALASLPVFTPGKRSKTVG